MLFFPAIWGSGSLWGAAHWYFLVVIFLYWLCLQLSWSTNTCEHTLWSWSLVTKVKLIFPASNLWPWHFWHCFWPLLLTSLRGIALKVHVWVFGPFSPIKLDLVIWFYITFVSGFQMLNFFQYDADKYVFFIYIICFLDWGIVPKGVVTFALSIFIENVNNPLLKKWTVSQTLWKYV